jgi:hypothetical protein
MASLPSLAAFPARRDMHPEGEALPPILMPTDPRLVRARRTRAADAARRATSVAPPSSRWR